jgi:hypothetical protein
LRTPWIRELAPQQDCRNLSVRTGQRLQTAEAASLTPNRLTNRIGNLAERLTHVDRGQCGEVTGIGGLRDLGATRQVRHAFSQAEPTLGAVGIAFGGTVDPQVAGVVDRRLDTQHRALLVVHLQRVVIHAVFDPQAFAASPQIAHQLACKLARNLLLAVVADAAQEPHHVATR